MRLVQQEFLSRYTTEELYATFRLGGNDRVGQDLYLLPILNCGGDFTRRLHSGIVWMSSGGTRSVIHADSSENIHCMIDGVKHWSFWQSKDKPLITSKEAGWVKAEDPQVDPKFEKAWGEASFHIDPGNVDVERFPIWDKLKRWNMTLEAGDCVFVPYHWYHYVEAPAVRSVSFHIWFHTGPLLKEYQENHWAKQSQEELTGKFEPRECDRLEKAGFNPNDFLVKLDTCEFGYRFDSYFLPKQCKHPGLPTDEEDHNLYQEEETPNLDQDKEDEL
eukprot:TRINITY_DN17407_c1_g2_i1.p1 TRINITY_DN17407_c1_g2~~TRINITY_DN17407_c1_g2_i1.p1  ORF type:complete len:275 (+),score=26.91 TRINITY_DN17407_c1_g2_i1:348-1172(+)